MNKIEKVFDSIDQTVDRQFGTLRESIKFYFPIISSLLLALLVVIFVLRWFYTTPIWLAESIRDDITLINVALEKIDYRCSILNIQPRNKIDFLNVKAFEGSQVSSINLVYPDKWDGPYYERQITYQEKFYELVRARDGYFIVPGDGVRLPNGLVMGKDVIASEKTSLGEKIANGGELNYKGIPLAKKIKFIIGDWPSKPVPEDPNEKQIKDVNRMLEELNAAAPFTKNELRQIIEKQLV